MMSIDSLINDTQIIVVICWHNFRLAKEKRYIKKQDGIVFGYLFRSLIIKISFTEDYSYPLVGICLGFSRTTWIFDPEVESV